MKTHRSHWKRTQHCLLLAAAFTLPQISSGQLLTNWTAFNEHAPGVTAPNVTTYNMRGFVLVSSPTDPGVAFPTSGPLTNFAVAGYAPGQSLSASLVVSTLVRNPDQFPNAALSYPFPGTPAYDLFMPGGVNIVDLANAGSAIGLASIPAGSIVGNDTVVLTFTNLDPAMRYAFRGTTVRNGSGIGTHSGRWTISSIAGADASVDAGTPGVLTSANLPGVPGLTLTNGQQVFQSGVNTNGDMVGWDNISPGSDGAFSVISKGYGGPVFDVYGNMGPNAGPGATFTNAYGNNGYALAAIALTEYGPATPVSIAVQPVSTTTLSELYPFKLSVKAFGSAPLYQWYKNSEAIPDANGETYAVAAATVGDSGSYTLVVSNALNSLTSIVAQVTVSADTVKPTVVSAISGGTFTQITVQFSERMDLSFGSFSPVMDFFNYSITGGSEMSGLTLSSAGTTESGTTVVLTVEPPLQENTVYQLTVSAATDLIGNMIDGSQSFTFRTWVASPAGGVKFEVFTGIGGNAVSDLVGHPSYPGSPAVTTNLTSFDSREFLPTDSLETYGGRLRGLFIPQASGDWIFYLTADDGSELYLNPTGPQAAGKTLIQSRIDCCASFVANASAPQSLTAGQAYYIEALYKEGGGGDLCRVAAKLSSDPTDPATLTPIPGTLLGYPSAPAGAAGIVSIIQQPAGIFTNANQFVTFTVGATNTFGLSMTYTWFKGGVVIPGASGPSCSFVATLADDGALITAEASIVGSKVLSSGATLSVNSDVVPPLVTSAGADGTFTRIIVRFNELMATTTAEDPFNYEISAGPSAPLFTGAVLQPDGKTVFLSLSPALLEDSTYTLAISSLEDLAGNTIASGTTVPVKTWKLVPSYLTFQTYDAGGGNAVSILTSHPSFPDSPRETLYLDAFDTRRVYPDDSHETYGGRISGVFVPPASGNWIFYLNADDGSELYLNPAGTDPAGKVLIQSRVDCCATFAANASAPQALVAGQPYYIEALYKEGGGGDYCRVAAKLDTNPTDPSQLSPISAGLLGTYVNPVGLSLTITTNPVNQFVARSTPSLVVGLEEFTTGTAGYSVVTGIEGGNALAPAELWIYSPSRGVWAANGGEGNKNSGLNSPFLTVTTPGAVSVTFSHRYNFEDDGGDPNGIRWDAGLLRVSVNRGPYITVPAASITGENYKTDKVIGGNCVPVAGQFAFNGQSPGFVTGTHVTSTAALGTFNAGDIISIQFLGAWDDGFVQGPAPGWEINSVSFSPALENSSADGTATFSVAATAVLNAAVVPATYQWQRNNGAGFIDIGGATKPSYSFLPTVADDGAIFRCVVRSPGAEATSLEATLFVVPKQKITLTGSTAVITWPAPSTGFVLEQATDLLTPATTIWTPVGIAPGVSAGLNTVTITGTGTGQKFYRLQK